VSDAPTELPGQIVLRDGTPALVWPLLATDAAGLREAFRQLSEDARWSRFLTRREDLDDAMLRRLVADVDGVRHVALVLLALPPDGPERPVGIGRLVQSDDDPAVADIALTVSDGWRGRGVGAALASALVAHRPASVRRIVTVVADGNRPILAVLSGLGATTTRRVGGGVLEVRVDLAPPPRPDGPAAGS
jgi:RimJ/RimL family protein N-acetyltransferase